MFSKAMLLEQITKRISEGERAAMENGGKGLVISQYNRDTILRILSMEKGDPNRALLHENAAIDVTRLEGLTRALKDYLNRYMAMRPEGHKWIILSCLFLTFIVNEPMHPQEIVHWERAGEQYRCPSREMREGSICQWCVCR